MRQFRVGFQLRVERGGEPLKHRRDRRSGLKLTWFQVVFFAGSRHPRPDAYGVSELFTLEVDDDNDEEVWALGDELRDVLERAGFESHRFGLNDDCTGPVVGVTNEPDSENARQADAICETFACSRQCAAEWEYDPSGRFYAYLLSHLS